MPEDRRHTSSVRRLAAIMFTDIVGYTSLMGKDEDRAFEILRVNKEIHERLISKYRGTFIKEMGDGILVSFNSSSDAVRCALEIQTESREKEISLKIGMHEGEMVFAGDDVLGDGVNIASRLQDVTEPGAVTVSEAIYRNVRNKPGIYTAFLEEKVLKNVDEPVKVYQVSDQEISVDVKKPEKPAMWLRKTGVYVMAATGILLVAAVLLWKFLPGNEKNLPSSEVVMDKTIAVLPFADYSPNKDNEYFCNGMMDVIITHLQKVGDLLVKSRTSVEQYRNRTKDVETIGKELKVAYVLEGSVGKIGDNYRINAQLIDTKTGNHLWAEYYDDKLTENIFEYQSELAKKVATSLHAVLTPDERNRIEKRPTEHAEAWDLIQKGFEMWNKQLESNDPAREIQLAFNLFRKALEIDPNYSEAYATIGWIYSMIGKPDSAMIYLDKALLLDPENASAYRNKGGIYRIKGNTDLAIEYLSKAVELAPNEVWANQILGMIYWRDLNDIRKGLPYINKLAQLDFGNKFDTYSGIGNYFITIGYYEKAEKYYRISIDLRPVCDWNITEYVWTLALQGKFNESLNFIDSICSVTDCESQGARLRLLVHTLLHEYKQAETAFNQLVEAGGSPFILDSVHVAYSYKKLGKKSEAMAILENINSSYGNLLNKNANWFICLCMASVQSQLENKEEALQYLSKAIEFGLENGGHDFLVIDPTLENLRDDPEFKALVKRAQDEKAAIRAQVKEMIDNGEIDL